MLGFEALGRIALGQIRTSLSLTLNASAGAYTLTGIAALFKVSEVASATSYSVVGNAARLTPAIVGAAGAFTETGVAALFSFNYVVAAGSITVNGQAASLTRDFVNWLPSTEPSSGWTAGALPSSTWTPAATPSTTWTVDPAQYIAPPESV